MSNEIQKQLSPELYAALQSERLILLGTIDHETKGPSINAISWVLATDRETIRFAMSSRSRLVENIRQEPKVTITLFAEQAVYSINGQARVVEEKMEDVQIHLAKVEIKIDSVFDVTFYGAQITQEPAYIKTYKQELAEKLDRQVTEALKKS